MKIRFCPKCKSVKVKIKITPSAVFGAPQQWACEKCGFESYAIFPEKEVEGNEKEKDDNKVKKKVKRK